MDFDLIIFRQRALIRKINISTHYKATLKDTVFRYFSMHTENIIIVSR